MRYSHLHTITNYSFLKGASHPQEFVLEAAELGYESIAITDECSLAGVVKAFATAEELGFKLIVGSSFVLSNGMQLIAIAPDRIAYAELSGFITLARRRMPKGEYEAHLDDLRFRLQSCLVIWIGQTSFKSANLHQLGAELLAGFKGRLWIGVSHTLAGGEQEDFARWQSLATALRIPMVACGKALMHARKRKPLHDTLTAIRLNTPLEELGTQLECNGEAYLKTIEELERLYGEALLEETEIISDKCTFSMAELRYQYPEELVPHGLRPIDYLRQLTDEGKAVRWPHGIPNDVASLLEKELLLIEELNYEFYFLTVHDIVRFARSKNILCQGRGSAANSVACYCLFITEIAPGQINVLFERFISKERDEPPDIDVDFEHQRREEVIQYIYEKYGRERAAITATVHTYHAKGAIRDVGKALGMEQSLVSHLSSTMSWWDKNDDVEKRIAAAGLHISSEMMSYFFKLVDQIIGFPRHLSQHTGGFLISQNRISDIVPVENASMADRTVIQWDKDDLETMKLLKIDVLSLGMLSALRRTIETVSKYDPTIKSIADIPREDKATYDMLCKGDSVGVFQIESRAQMAMLPRLQPRCFYDLIIEIAIVRPGPIQGDMVHPYLRRRSGEEPISYQSDEIEEVLRSTLGIPIFQEQVMRLSMVAAGFSGGEADQLRRAMTNWGKNSKLLLFQDRFINGFIANGYSKEFAERMFEQVKGFGGYGFPESHSASFALLCYSSSWLKCHHPAAFYCAILNSQPMGFYTPSQLVQDARRHDIQVFPVDINFSMYENSLEKDHRGQWGIRLGFISITSIKSEQAQQIETWRGNTPFKTLQDVSRRTQLSDADIQCLASGDAFRAIVGNRHKARWEAANLTPYSELLDSSENLIGEDLLTPLPTLKKEVMDDYAAIGLTLRSHPMALLREEKPFNRCSRYADLINLRNHGFVRIAGIITGKQRPGTASGVMFMSLEDETGTANVVIWNKTQETFRKTILTAKLVIVTGTVEIVTDKVGAPVIHVIAGNIRDHSNCLNSLSLKSRDFR